MALFRPVSCSSVSTAAAVSSLSFALFLLVAAAKGQQGFDLGQEKKTHLHFFFHNVLSGSNPTAILVAQAPAATARSLNGFGDIMMIDDALTEGPDPTSKLVGRAQGMYALASQEETAMLMAVTFYFLDGDYNGSTVAILGRNSASSATREMAVVGGTGYFRLARGYALAKTQTANLTTLDANMEYDVYVIHQGPQGPGTGTSGSRVNTSPSPSASSHSLASIAIVLLLQALPIFLLFTHCI